LKKFVYLNNAATSFPKPALVINAVKEVIDNPPFEQYRASFKDNNANLIQECRRELASFFNAPDENSIVFTSGATESFNVAINGLFEHKKHVITTTLEHNSILRPLKTLEKEKSLTLTIVSCDKYGQLLTEDIEKAITADTKALIVNHCSNVNGAINDIEAIGKIAHKYQLVFIVDCSQSAGVYPIDIQKMHIDILVFTGHKSLNGMQGIGGLYINKKVQIKPLKTGGTGMRSDYLYQPETRPMYFEAGTQNIVGIVSLLKGMQFIKKQGLAKIRKKKEEMVLEILEFLSKKNKVFLYQKIKPAALLCFNIKGMAAQDVGYILEHSFNITTRAGLHCAPLIHECIGSYPKGSVRISPSFFNTSEEIRYFYSAIDKIVDTI
jgi:cysteine desulfurase family protein